MNKVFLSGCFPNEIYDKWLLAQDDFRIASSNRQLSRLLAALLLLISVESFAADSRKFADLEKMDLDGRGLVLVSPSQGVGHYDAVRFVEIEIRYQEGQKPMSKRNENKFRKYVLSEVSRRSSEGGTEVVQESGNCVLDVSLGVVNIEFSDSTLGSSSYTKNLGSAVLAFDMRDSTTGEQLAFLAGRRNFGGGVDHGTSREDLKRLSTNVGELMAEMGYTLGLVVAETRDRGDKPGCNGQVQKYYDSEFGENQR